MPPLRYYVLATDGAHLVELFKIEHGPRRTVIVPSPVGRMVETASIHITHHPPKDGMSTRIIHASDAAGTDHRFELDPSAHSVELGRMAIDLSDFDWEGAKPFKKTAVDEKYVVDIAEDGPCITCRFYIGAPAVLIETMEAVLRSDDPGMVVMSPGKFGTPPGGHPIRFHRLVFDDEAAVTVGCLLLTCEKPEVDDASAEEPWRGERLEWVAYGTGGDIAEGVTE